MTCEEKVSVTSELKLSVWQCRRVYPYFSDLMCCKLMMSAIIPSEMVLGI